MHGQPPAHGWLAHGQHGLLIARNYPNWTRDWWSPNWGVWFRFDPETRGYYYYEPDVGAYVQTEYITTYRERLETPIIDPPSDPDDLPDDGPPDPVEP
jgi:hypothetical protein